MGRIRLGVIGCGNMEASHEAGLTALGDQLEITATADILEDRAQKAAAKLGAKHVATDYRDILPHVDAVLVSLPHDLHHSTGIDCLKAGKHVLMEKPLANTEDECLDLIHTAARVNKVLMTGYVMRYHPLVIKMKELLDARTYGDVFQVSMWTEQHSQFPAGNWHTIAARLGGGQFFSHGCHYIDLLLWYLGRPVAGTHVGTRLGTPWMEREGTSNVSIEFENGALGYHFGTWGARGTRLKYSFHAHCTDGMLEAQFRTGKLILHRKSEETVLLESEGFKPTREQLQHFCECVRENKRPRTDGVGSIQSLRVIWRLYEAEQKGLVADLRGLGLDQEWDRPGLGALPEKMEACAR